MNPPPTPAGPPSVAPSVIWKIDLCRGLFAFLGVAAHAFDACCTIQWGQISQIPEPWATLLHNTVQYGAYWVMGFFVISGYCIQLSVGRQLDQGPLPLPIYLAARLTRIAPLYYAGLLFALVVECLIAPIRVPYYPDGVDGGGFLAQVFFTQRLVRTFGAFAPSWTITNEMFYYLLFGGIAALFGGHRSRPAWVGMALSIVVGGLMQGLYLSGTKHPVVLRVGLLFGLGINWFLGALVAAHGDAWVKSPAVRRVRRFWPVIFLGAVGLNVWDRCPDQVLYLVLGVAFALMMVRFLARAYEQSLFGNDAGLTPSRKRLAEVVGLASYPTYLFHAPILLTLVSVLAWSGQNVPWWATWMVLVSTGIGVGTVLGWTVERPLMTRRAAFLKRWKNRQTKPSAVPAGRHPALSQGA